MEWTIVTVIVSLVGLLIAIGTPIVKLNSTITKLTTQIDFFINGLNEFKKRYTNQVDSCKKKHADIYDKVNDHEHRITILETTNKE